MQIILADIRKILEIKLLMPFLQEIPDAFPMELQMQERLGTPVNIGSGFGLLSSGLNLIQWWRRSVPPLWG